MTPAEFDEEHAEALIESAGRVRNILECFQDALDKCKPDFGTARALLEMAREAIYEFEVKTESSDEH